MKQQIVILKMKSGLEVVGSLILDQSKDYNSISIQNPLQIIYKNIPGYSFPIISLKHYILFAVDNARVAFRKADITNVVPARPSFVKFYVTNVNKKELITDVDQQLESLSFYDTPEEERSVEDKAKRKQANYRHILELFDETGRKPN